MIADPKRRTLRTRFCRLCLLTSICLTVGLCLLSPLTFENAESENVGQRVVVPVSIDTANSSDTPISRHIEETWMHKLFTEASFFFESETNVSADRSDTGDADQLKNDEFCSRMVHILWESILPSRLSSDLREAVEELRDRHAAVARGSPYVDQKYVVWSLSGGMGNRFQAMISTFAMALVSKRVFLMKDWFSPTLYARSARRSSQSLLPFVRDNVTGGQRFYRYEDIAENFWFSNGQESTARPANRMLFCESLPVMSLSEFQAIYPDEFRHAENKTGTETSSTQSTHSIPQIKHGHAKIDLRANHDKTLQAWGQLACGETMSTPSNRMWNATSSGDVDFFSSEKFVYIWTNQYFLPVFCANHRVMQRMGPLCSGSAFRTLLPLFFIPARPVMRRVVSFFQENPQHIRPGEYVALQIRTLSRVRGAPLGEVFDTCYKSQSNRFPHFYLATIERDAFAHFQERYEKHNLFLNVDNRKAADTGVQSTGRGVEGEWMAMAEVVIQSLAGSIIVTPKSTFGFLAWSIGEFSDITIINQNLARGNDDPHRVCVVRNTDYVTEPCFSSWHRYESLLAQRRRFPCALSNLPDSFQHCGT